MQHFYPVITFFNPHISEPHRQTGVIYQKHETKGVLYSLQLSKEFEHFGQFLVYLSVIRILKADENDNLAVKNNS